MVLRPIFEYLYIILVSLFWVLRLDIAFKARKNLVEQNFTKYKKFWYLGDSESPSC